METRSTQPGTTTAAPSPLHLTGTVHHDGHGGVTDDLATVAGFLAWAPPGTPEELRDEVIDIRRAVRTLFAYATGREDSRADPGLSRAQALDLLNSYTERGNVTVRLDWPDPGAAPLVRLTAADPADLPAQLARSAVEFLAGPQRERLRACPAPYCVRYFVQDHGRQTYCKTSCANRARAARHYARNR
ncbi:CGNR zinc finger domain-containing protein [Streptomyces sp. LaPpAH-108]|uniref:CGNR zinc finger domain-containing protein n=1 Tax=Streptomyces sp. LaPpAH-108 TaxID=1155714 RepID=UPI0006872F0A|nr:ABATE domain-containing protein [Streptomyces sp. LaPpAH-108]